MLVRNSKKWLVAGVLLATATGAEAQPMKVSNPVSPAPGFGATRGTVRGQAPDALPPAQPVGQVVVRCGTACYTLASPAPFGASVYGHFRTQVNAGTAGRMALYDYDFVPGTSRLNPRGADRVRQIATLLPNFDNPVVVARVPNMQVLAEARRQAVIDEFTRVGVVIPADRVVVGVPGPVPLHGAEAELIYDTLLQQTQSAGRLPGTGANTSSFGSNGFSGGSGTGGSSQSGTSSGGSR